ncbi:MAG: 30S ribosomal protein S16 [Planctomycetota bacterium]
MSVRIRMKRLGRKNRPFYRLCAIDQRSPRDGRVLEELGHYDPMCKEVDARAILKGDRIDYWLSVGAQPSENAVVLIKKYGSKGTHLSVQQEALARLGRTPAKTKAAAPAT